MAEKIKFTDEEIQSINELRQEVGTIFTQLGQLSIQKARTLQQLEEQEANLIQAHQDSVKKESELFKGLNEKYGDGNFDPATGEFIPAPKEETTEVEG